MNVFTGDESHLIQYLTEMLTYAEKYREPFFRMGALARAVAAGEPIPPYIDIPVSASNLWKEERDKVLSYFNDLIPVPNVKSKKNLPKTVAFAESLNEELDTVFAAKSWRNSYRLGTLDELDWGAGLWLTLPNYDDTIGVDHVDYPDVRIDPMSSPVDPSVCKFFCYCRYAYRDDIAAVFRLNVEDIPICSEMKGHEVVGVQRLYESVSPVLYSLSTYNPNDQPNMLRMTIDRGDTVTPLNGNICQVWYGWFVDDSVESGIRHVVWIKDWKVLLKTTWKYPEMPHVMALALETGGQALSMTPFVHVYPHQAASKYIESKIAKSVSLSAEPVPIMNESDIKDAQGNWLTGEAFNISAGRVLTWRNHKPEFMQMNVLNGDVLSRPQECRQNSERGMGLSDVMLGRNDKQKTLGEVQILLDEGQPRLKLMMQSIIEAVQDIARKVGMMRIRQMIQVGSMSEEDVQSLMFDMDFNVELRNVSTSKKKADLQDFMAALEKFMSLPRLPNGQFDRATIFAAAQFAGVPALYKDFEQELNTFEQQYPPVPMPVAQPEQTGKEQISEPQPIG